MLRASSCLHCNSHTTKLCLIFLIISSTSATVLPGQTTNLSGELSYTLTEVTNFDSASNSLTATNAASFYPNDKVLLIKMQGSEMDADNNTSFGDLGQENAVGKFEIAYVCDVLGNQVSFQYTLENNYAPNNSFTGKMQMIKIPQYPHINVNGTLTAPAWNGSTGGILIIEGRDSITLNADIDMNGRGFRGGSAQVVSNPCTMSTNDPTRFYYTSASLAGGWKGEGIAEYIAGRETGKGHQVNGGGGGNDPNTGGGGGSNYGTGGAGGQTTQSTCNGNNAGFGGEQLPYNITDTKIFMGGGGGAGHSYANVASTQPGANGGGIIILITPAFTGNGYSLFADGSDAAASADGGSGGGGGGTILIDAASYFNNFNLSAEGGTGGISATQGADCQGPGGGGGGGLIWAKVALGAGITTDVNGGSAGTISTTNGLIPVWNGVSGCGGLPNSATAGLTGSSLSGLSIPESITPATPCILANKPNADGLRINQPQELDCMIKPNPVNTQSPLKVRVSMPESGPVILSLINQLGEQKHSQIHWLEAGVQDVKWPALNLSPGVYILRLNYEGQLVSRYVLVQ